MPMMPLITISHLLLEESTTEPSILPMPPTLMRVFSLSLALAPIWTTLLDGFSNLELSSLAGIFLVPHFVLCSLSLKRYIGCMGDIQNCDYASGDDGCGDASFWHVNTDLRFPDVRFFPTGTLQVNAPHSVVVDNAYFEGGGIRCFSVFITNQLKNDL